MRAAIRTISEADLQALLRAGLRLGSNRHEARDVELVSNPVLAALRRCGTRHLYVDTADVRELRQLLEVAPGVLRAEIDGNTANQPLVQKVAQQYVESCDVQRWDDELRTACPDALPEELAPWLYALLCASLGNEIVQSFAAGRRWDVSLQLHMSLLADPQAAVRIGMLLAQIVPGVLIKVPFAPDAPQCLLVARDLRRVGIPVNLTSTFSARQVAAAALLAEAARTNVFLGRINEGLQATMLGEQTMLESQRSLLDLRRADGVETELIAASLRDESTVPLLAGCDAYTAPCRVLSEVVERPPESIVAQLDASYANRYRVAGEAESVLGREAIERLFRIEPEFVTFLRDWRRSTEWAHLTVDDGEVVRDRFAEAGFGDLFYEPDGTEQAELARSKLPLLDGRLVGRLALDTHYSLMANADFSHHQAAIDGEIAAGVKGDRLGDAGAEGTDSGSAANT